jgi:hypothetical protein
MDDASTSGGSADVGPATDAASGADASAAAVDGSVSAATVTTTESGGLELIASFAHGTTLEVESRGEESEDAPLDEGGSSEWMEETRGELCNSKATEQQQMCKWSLRRTGVLLP